MANFSQRPFKLFSSKSHKRCDLKVFGISRRLEKERSVPSESRLPYPLILEFSPITRGHYWRHWTQIIIKSTLWRQFFRHYVNSYEMQYIKWISSNPTGSDEYNSHIYAHQGIHLWCSAHRLFFSHNYDLMSKPNGRNVHGHKCWRCSTFIRICMANAI